MPAVARIDSPLGPLTVVAENGAVTRLDFGATAEATAEDAVLERLAEELAAYFAGELSEFVTPLAPAGTPFQRRVWDELLRVPLGETRSYAAIARALGDPAATRAVGAANGANPIALAIPCHRVVRTGGALGGYGGGLERKRWLLEHEARVAGSRLFH